MTRDQMAAVMERVFDECEVLRNAGQLEYAHDADNAFANFERLAAKLKMSREQVLWVYAEKHLDGIVAWINGHRSQREGVAGRINDAIVYLTLLRGMADEREAAALLIRERIGKEAAAAHKPGEWVVVPDGSLRGDR